MTMQPLDTFTLPLNQSVLIEASAGTGKTYTMANIYLRLLLGVKCAPLTIDQILVVTFTRAATQELRDRIRRNISQVAKLFASYADDPTSRAKVDEDPFFSQVYHAVQPHLSEALLRLRIAERDIDLASIFTIDSFCQQMLFQFAFDSGMRFDIDLQTDESELLTRLSEETWRELYYAADYAQAEMIANLLGNPANALEKVKTHLSNLLPAQQEEEQAWLAQDPLTLGKQLQQFIQEAKTFWQTHFEALTQPVLDAVQKREEQGIKSVSGTYYRKEHVASRVTKIASWMRSESLSFPDEMYYFTQSMLEKGTVKGGEAVVGHHYVQSEDIYQRYHTQFQQIPAQQMKLVCYQFFQHLNQKLSAYKDSHLEKNFTDMKPYFYHALQGEQAQTLAQKLRNQGQFAMIAKSQNS